MLGDPEFSGLSNADITANGLREPIVLWEGQIIDGRNRMTACQRAGVPPTLTTLLHCPDPVAYVLSANLHRRHLTDDDRALCAARMKAHYQERAAKNHAEASKSGGKKAGRGRAIGVATSETTPIDGAKWSELAASDWKVSRGAIERADALLSQRETLPELHDAVKAGEVSLSKAATVAKATCDIILPLRKWHDLLASADLRSWPEPTTSTSVEPLSASASAVAGLTTTTTTRLPALGVTSVRCLDAATKPRSALTSARETVAPTLGTTSSPCAAPATTTMKTSSS